jgi:uncharacterized protein YdiU (UPF0061 family)
LLHEQPEQAVEVATRVIDDFPALYESQWLAVMRRKLGLQATPAAQTPNDADDLKLAQDFLATMQGQGVDYTLAFRQLADVAETGNADGLRTLYDNSSAFDAWLPRWQQRLALAGGAEARAQGMRSVNPWVVARNQRVEDALTAASAQGDMVPFSKLLALLQQPFTPPPQVAGLQSYTHPAPPAQSACFQTFCGT